MLKTFFLFNWFRASTLKAFFGRFGLGVGVWGVRYSKLQSNLAVGF